MSEGVLPTRLIALDIDGTLDSPHGVSQAVREAVTALRSDGWHIVLSTGRSILATLPVIEVLGLDDGFAVCSNGAYVARIDPSAPGGYTTFSKVTFDARPALAALLGGAPDVLAAAEINGVGYRTNAPFPDGALDGVVEVVGFDELVADQTTRVVVFAPGSSSADFAELAESVGLDGVAYTVGYSAWLDITAHGTSKAFGLEKVRTALGVDPAGTVAIGDGQNDIEMFGWASRSIAMGNAVDELKAVADEVTATVDEDGAARAMRALLDDATETGGYTRKVRAE